MCDRLSRHCAPRHLKEDLEKFTDGKDDLNEWDLDSEENSVYHFFKMHDYDKNNKLDGLEIGNVVARWKWISMLILSCVSSIL